MKKYIVLSILALIFGSGAFASFDSSNSIKVSCPSGYKAPVKGALVDNKIKIKCEAISPTTYYVPGANVAMSEQEANRLGACNQEQGFGLIVSNGKVYCQKSKGKFYFAHKIGTPSNIVNGTPGLSTSQLNNLKVDCSNNGGGLQTNDDTYHRANCKKEMAATVLPLMNQ